MIALLEELCSLFLFCSLSAYTIWHQERALKRLTDATSARTLTPLAAYQQYARARQASVRGIRNITLIALVLIVLLLVYGVPFSSLGLPQLPLSSLGYSVALSSVLALGLADVGMTVLVDRKALNEFENNMVTQREVLTQKLKQVSTEWVPLVLYLQVVLILEQWHFSTLPLILTALGAFLTSALLTYDAFFVRWKQASIPLEQTMWFQLVPRLQAWANTAGIELPELRATQDMQVGKTGIKLVGLSKPTILVSMTLLRYTDWRQQDALFMYTVGLVKQNFVRKTLISGISIFLVALFLFGLVALLLILKVFWIVPLLALVFIVLRRSLTMLTRRTLARLHFEADKVGISLTGDPLGLMVALSVMDALNGRSTKRRSSLLLPTTQKRLEALDRFLQDNWPCAPYATTPVQSIIPVQFKTHLLTVPFTQSGPSRYPVPPHPYIRLTQ